MQKFTTVDLLRDTKTVTMAADRHPVAITQHRKPRYVLMTYDEFEAMKSRAILGGFTRSEKRRRS